MTEKYFNTHKTPVILVNSASVAAFRIFNQNDWTGLSRAVVRSCAAQLGLLNYSVDKLRELFNISNKLCEPKFNELKNQWNTSKWPIEKMDYFAEIPEVHLFIQVFLNSIKTFLDLIVQLISTERIVNKKIHGFHKKGKDPGGEILHILKNKQTNKKIAEHILKLIEEHKRKWVDDAVNARDSLVHPEMGLIQVMFEIEITSTDSELELSELKKPYINNIYFDRYAKETYRQLIEFSQSFIKILRGS